MRRPQDQADKNEQQGEPESAPADILHSSTLQKETLHIMS
jgi:hypothetical protein